MQELNWDVVVVTGKGKAISKAVTVVEILKRAVPGLHQETSIATEAAVDRWEAAQTQEQPLDRSGRAHGRGRGRERHVY